MSFARESHLKRISIIRSTLLLFIFLGLSTSTPILGAQLHGHLPKDLEKAKIEKDVPETEHMGLAIGLSYRNKSEFEKCMKDIKDPKSPQHQHRLTTKQFEEKFRPTQSDYKTCT